MAYPVALGKLVQELVGVRLGKALTFSHWDQRPLSPNQLRYRRDDVRYLPACGARSASGSTPPATAAWAKAESESAVRAIAVRLQPRHVLHARPRRDVAARRRGWQCCAS
jgi:hypothetical protein